MFGSQGFVEDGTAFGRSQTPEGTAGFCPAATLFVRSVPPTSLSTPTLTRSVKGMRTRSGTRRLNTNPKTSQKLEARILALRRQRRSYAQILMVLPVSKATLSRVLRRHGLHRLTALEAPKPPPIRYERDAPGDLLHLDIKKLGRFTRPGVRATGDRTQRNPGAGVESLHVAIDDHSRLAFATLCPDEKIPSVLDALQQAVGFYNAHGIQIQRVLTDRGLHLSLQTLRPSLPKTRAQTSLHSTLSSPD
jgi:hypothetical protein